MFFKARTVISCALHVVALVTFPVTLLANTPLKPGCTSLLRDEEPKIAHEEYTAAMREVLPAKRYYTVKVYHKGQLQDGSTSDNRPFSTALERESVAALDRAGVVHEFEIPKKLLQEWTEQDLARVFRDLDQATGVVNEEVRFYGKAAIELTRFEVKEGEVPLAQQLEDAENNAARKALIVRGRPGFFGRLVLELRFRLGW